MVGMAKVTDLVAALAKKDALTRRTTIPAEARTLLACDGEGSFKGASFQ
jgi:hypothetical protein